MALLTRRREPELDMIHRTRRPVVIVLVAADTRSIRGSQVVIVVDVAHHASHRWVGVITSQGEAGFGVIKLGRLPGGRVVTHLAGLREVAGHVIRISSAVEVFQVAVGARRVRCGQAVVVVDVTLRALHAGCVEAGQWPTCRRVIKLGVSPVRRIVALLAGGRESKLDMVYRCGRAVVIVLVTADARGAAQRVVVVDVAHHACHRRVSVEASQRESNRAVIKSCWRPSGRRMALLAAGRESRSGMHRVISFLEVGLVTGNASGIRCTEIVIVVGMATGARNGGVHTGQRESGSRVIEFRIQPIIEAMALLAACRKLASHVIRVDRLIKVARVAAIAIGGHRAELAQRTIFMTSVAFNRSMSSK